MQSSTIKIWIYAARFHTLPLAVSGILLGNFLAWKDGNIYWHITFLTLLTAILLQILSNFANDYGDTIHGADSENRTGPERAVQSGSISPKAMQFAIVNTSVLTFISGCLLLYFSMPLIGIEAVLILLGIGILSILAAITYTASGKPYGYIGLGDLSVFIFFGFVGVAGSFYLNSGYIDWLILLPAASFGFFSVAILNINNIRDIASDIIAGKKTIPVRLGDKAARIYHLFLVLAACFSAVIYAIYQIEYIWQYLFLFAFIPIVKNLIDVWKGKTAVELTPSLKQMVLATSLFAIVYGLLLAVSGCL